MDPIIENVILKGKKIPPDMPTGTLMYYNPNLGDRIFSNKILPRRDLVNLLPNGNFVNTTGWSNGTSSLTVSNNVATLTGSGAGQYPTLNYQTSVAYNTGDKIYFRYTSKSLTASCQAMTAKLQGSVSGNNDAIVTQSSPVNGTAYTKSGVVALVTGSGNINVLVYQAFADAATANGKAVEWSNVIVVNLTQVFGAGIEPTTAQMDAIISSTGLDYWEGSITNPLGATTPMPTPVRVGATKSIGSQGYVDRFDGVDDRIDIPTHSNIDVTTASPSNPLGLWCLFKVATGSASFFPFSKGKTTGNLKQYGFYWDSVNKKIGAVLSGVSAGYSANNSVIEEKIYIVGLLWNGSTSIVSVNFKDGTSEAVTGTLISYPEFYIFKNMSGTFGKGDLAFELITQGATLNDVKTWFLKNPDFRKFQIPV